MSSSARIGLVLALLSSVVTAEAGDIAEHRILGFSPDGSVFAFEEFGVQDGSGFPYANIYVVDTNTDSWVPGSPVRLRIDEETAPLSMARAQARQQAAPILEQFAVEDRALTLAANPLGELGADPVSVDFGQPFPANPLRDIDRRYNASLDIYDAETPGEACETYIGDKPKGFRLTLRNLATGVETVLHEDVQIPQSRGCPITYRIDAVTVPDGYPADKVAVVMSIFQPGFEGPQRRFLAVTGDLPR